MYWMGKNQSCADRRGKSSEGNTKSRTEDVLHKEDTACPRKKSAQLVDVDDTEWIAWCSIRPQYEGDGSLGVLQSLFV